MTMSHVAPWQCERTWRTLPFTMPDPDLDRLLREFLEREREEVRQGITLASVARAQKTLADGLGEFRKDVDGQFKELETQMRSHDHRLTTLEAQRAAMKEDLERVEEVTGRHQVAEVLDAAAKLSAVARPHARASVHPFARMLQSEAARWTMRGLALLLAGAVGWVIRHMSWR